MYTDRCLCTCLLLLFSVYLLFFFFNDTAPTEIYTLSLHDALPIFLPGRPRPHVGPGGEPGFESVDRVFLQLRDRKSTRLNSSHANISYAVFCLKKKKKKKKTYNTQQQQYNTHISTC